MARPYLRLEVPFAMVPEWVLHHPGLTDRAVRLYGALARYGDRPVPSLATLARQLGCSTDTVRRAVANLEAEGVLVKRYRRGPDGEQVTNLYELRHVAPMPPPPGTAATGPPGTAATQTKPPTHTQPAAGAGAAQVRPRDELAEALAKGLQVNLGDKWTKDARGRFNAALGQLREAGATPTEVLARCGRWRAQHPERSMWTPQAITGNWSLLGDRDGSSVPREQQPCRWQRHEDDDERGPWCVVHRRWEVDHG